MWVEQWQEEKSEQRERLVAQKEEIGVISLYAPFPTVIAHCTETAAQYSHVTSAATHGMSQWPESCLINAIQAKGFIK